MPLLDRLTTPGDGSDRDHRRRTAVADHPGRSGVCLFARGLRGLERQLAENRQPPRHLDDLATEAEQRVWCGGGLRVEQDAIRLDHRVKAGLIDRIYRNLFSFGPLDDALLDRDVIEITATGPTQCARAAACRAGTGPAGVRAPLRVHSRPAAGCRRDRPGRSIRQLAVLKGRRARRWPVRRSARATIPRHPPLAPTLDDLAAAR